MNLIFQENSDFDNWLKQYDHFEDGNILEIKPNINHQNIEFILARYISSKYKSNPLKTFQVFKIIANNVSNSTRWNLSYINRDRYILPIEVNMDVKSMKMGFTYSWKDMNSVNAVGHIYKEYYVSLKILL